MEDKIYNIIKNKKDNITFKELLKRIDIDAYELQNILLKLKINGKILQIGNKYMIFPDDLSIGTIMTEKSGKKYLVDNNRIIDISYDTVDSVILNDIVTYRINDNKKAEIVSIIDRPLGKMTCHISIIDGHKKIIPYIRGINITLPKDVMDELYDGDIIVVDTKPNEVGEYVDAKFIKKIGRIDDPSIYDLEIGINYGFDNDYSPEYLEELKTYPTCVRDEDLVGRVDYRNQQNVTIDRIDTKDMDDSVYAERLNDDVIRVYVHKAHVPYYVKPGSLVFNRLWEKTTSCYINNSVFPMLHPVLSDGICSLTQGEDRLTTTTIMDIDSKGNIVNFDYVQSVINSKKKMDYDSVDQILLNNITPTGYENFTDELKLLYEAAMRIRERYHNNGMLEFANMETKKIYNDDGTIKEIDNPTYSPSAKLIEFLMLAAGETIGTFAYNLGIPFNYRVLEEPDSGHINNSIDKINALGFNFKYVGEGNNRQEISKILTKTRNTEFFPIVCEYLIRGLKRAGYDTNNIGHYALAMLIYAQITSPARRGTDFGNIMLLDMYLDNYKIYECDLEKLTDDMQLLCMRASMMERAADKASYEGERRAIIQKLEKLVGEEFEATICEIDRKIRVKLYGIDTFIDFTDLSNNFEYDSKKRAFYDIYTNEYLMSGSPVIVKLTNANAINRDFNVTVLGINNNISKVKTKQKQR